MRKTIRILNVGKWAIPQDAGKPYYATLDLKGDGVGAAQPMSEKEFFRMMNSFLEPREEACGNTHVLTVWIEAPDTH
jgi:hypothetical protein